MDLTADLPVTLVVKAANQRIADQTVECVLGWTVRKLKRHLENVYPSKPKHHTQKLIYSGQLLADHLTLKDVLRQYSSQNSKHTMHLVCSCSSESLSQTGPSTNTFVETPKSELRATLSQTSTSSLDSEGIRHRGTRSQSVSTTDLPNAGANPTMPLPGAIQMPGVPAMAGMQGFPMMGMPGYGYTPEQLAWMQQMYSQYMAQYMQYYGYQAPVPPQAAVAATQVQQQAANPNAANNGQANPNMRMNAQGGMEEDDEEFGQRDWLDYVYVFFRFLVLLSIVYFYSSASRFLAVSMGFFAIYILQNGWFNRQQNRQQPPAPAAPAQQPIQDQQPTPERQQQREEAVVNNSDRPNGSQEEQAGEQVEGGAEREPDGTHHHQDPDTPSGFSVMLNMFTTFFTSLIPTQPQAVNGN